ncbi:MAG: fumarate hydratase [Nitrospirae bacterium]|nr:fumarate hydratase [Nitrospirota bacterium]
MREIKAETISQTITQLCKEANFNLPEDVLSALESALKREKTPRAQEIIKDLLENAAIAHRERLPLCQDTGMAAVFLEIGQEVMIVKGDLKEAINAGVRRGYREGYLRKSVVKDPLIRENTGDNTPAILHIGIVPGEKLKITVFPKGFGSENVSALTNLLPSQGKEGVKEFILKTVKKSGAKGCPPLVVGVGLGGTMEKAALLAKQALLRPLNSHHQDKHIAQLEEETLEEINQLGIGPQGLGGETTALGVNIETYPTHIAGLPVAVNISCHALRQARRVL